MFTRQREQTAERTDQTYDVTERGMTLMRAMAADVLARGNRALFVVDRSG